MGIVQCTKHFHSPINWIGSSFLTLLRLMDYIPVQFSTNVPACQRRVTILEIAGRYTMKGRRKPVEYYGMRERKRKSFCEHKPRFKRIIITRIFIGNTLVRIQLLFVCRAEKKTPSNVFLARNNNKLFRILRVKNHQS